MTDVKDIDRGPMPQPECLKDVFWILSRCIWPVILQSVSYALYPRTSPYLMRRMRLMRGGTVEWEWSLFVAYPLYLLGFSSFLLMVVARLTRMCPSVPFQKRCRTLMLRWDLDQAVNLGTFSEKVTGRDRMPDDAAKQLARYEPLSPSLSARDQN